MLVLNAPQRPRSLVSTRRSTLFSGAAREQRMIRRSTAASPIAASASRAARDLGEHLAGLHRVGPERGDALLRAVQARAGDHLHRARDLLRRT